MLNSSISAVLLCLQFTTQPAFATGGDMASPPSPAATRRTATAANSCGLEAVRRYVGSDSTPPTRTVVANAVGHTRIRWIRPGEVVTQDYRDDRLNIIVDTDGRILTMRCG